MKLKIARAGAGSGKTYWLCEQIAGQVVEGLDPARIIATTFTKKAAAELKGRIQARLLREERLSADDRSRKAERLDLAAIGTVHSVGHQLLRRYAIPLGFSPELEVLDEDASKRALKALLDRSNPASWDELNNLARRFSMGNPQETAVKLLSGMRANRIDAKTFRKQMQENAARFLSVMAPEGPDKRGVSFKELYVLAGDALVQMSGKSDITKITAECKQKLHLFTARTAETWEDFAVASNVSAGKRSGADACLNDLRAAGDDILRHPGLHADVRALVESLTRATLNLDGDYAQYKRERGLVDFTDLEVMLLELLENSALAPSISADFELVAVDEFQDTNPLQLAIFQRLRGLVKDTLWVGDKKQAIFGFRSTDPELVESVWDRVPKGSVERLPQNRRSVEGLVQLVGELFEPVFGDEARLKAHRKGKSGDECVERWVFATRNISDDCLAMTAGLLKLRMEGVSLCDVAVLVRENKIASALAAACREHGVPALIALPGLMNTREGALTRAGLQLVADRRDSLAAATILHILGDPKEETPSWFTERLQQVASVAGDADDGAAEEGRSRRSGIPWADEPRLAGISSIDHRDLPPRAILDLVISGLDIGNHVRRWGNVAERAANLDALREMAENYESSMRGLGLASTLTGLISWLDELSDDEKDATNPPFGVDAVTILTYHRAKGLEWPVVVLAQLDTEYEPDMFEPRVTGISKDPDSPLADRCLRYWPWPFGSGGHDLKDMALDTVEGHEATERDRAENLRLLYVGFTRAKDKLILAHRQGKTAWLDKLEKTEQILPDGGKEGKFALNGIKGMCVVRRLDAPMAEALKPDPVKKLTWLESLSQLGKSAAYEPRFVSPSSVEPPAARSSQKGDIAVEVIKLADRVIRIGKDPEVENEDVGNAVHAYFAALPSLVECSPKHKESVALRCLASYGVDKLISAPDLVAMGERLQSWIDKTYPGAVWKCEIPFMAPKKSPSVSDGAGKDGKSGHWNGIIDLLLLLPDGKAVIIDHKASAIPPEKSADKARSYAGQLLAYREALEAQGMKVEAMWVHLALAGVVGKVCNGSGG